MPVIALASSKGGCGKSTTVLLLAGAYAADGYRVHIIDADRSARLANWAEEGAKKGSKPEAITASKADDRNLTKEIEAAKAFAEIILIDVEGSANASVPIAISKSDAVIIPANPSAPDVEDAIRTVDTVRDMSDYRHIPYALLWSRVPSAIRSREMDALEADVVEYGIPILGQVHERTAYKSLFSYSTTLDRLPLKDVPTRDKAIAEATVIAAAVGELLGGGAAQTENAA